MCEMSQILYSASVDAVKELLAGDGHYVPPPRLLEDLTEAQAMTTPSGSPSSIAQVLSHTHYCQEEELAGLRGEPWPRPPFVRPVHLDDTFAPIPPGSWPTLVAAFLAGLEACKRLAEAQPDAVSPARDDTTANYDLAGTALHNAYHLGQIVLLRRMLGLWPPAGGEPYDY
jgi:DinB superfamily